MPVSAFTDETSKLYIKVYEGRNITFTNLTFKYITIKTYTIKLVNPIIDHPGHLLLLAFLSHLHGNCRYLASVVKKLIRTATVDPYGQREMHLCYYVFFCDVIECIHNLLTVYLVECVYYFLLLFLGKPVGDVFASSHSQQVHC